MENRVIFFMIKILFDLKDMIDAAAGSVIGGVEPVWGALLSSPFLPKSKYKLFNINYKFLQLKIF